VESSIFDVRRCFRDIIEKEEVVVSIDDVMIATETEEGHDEIVKKVLRRMKKK